MDSTLRLTFPPLLLRWTARGRRAIRRLNVFYLLSALLMLLGCYLVCIPYLYKPRALGALLALLGTINLYEALVIATCVYLIRRAPFRREVPLLLLIEVAFLFDGTFTVNACVTAHYLWGLVITAGSLALGFAKLFVLDRASRGRLFGARKAFLAAGMVFLYTFQPFLALYSGAGEDFRLAREFLVFSVWSVFAVLALFLSLKPARPAPPVLHPVLKSDAAVLAGAVLLAQWVGQGWVHEAPFHAAFLLPLAFAAMALLPRPEPLHMGPLLLEGRTFCAVGLVAVGFALPNAPKWELLNNLREPWAVLSPLRVALAMGAWLLFRAWQREGHAALLNAFAVLSFLAVAGHDAQSVARFVEAPEPDKVALLLPVASWWALRQRSYLRALLGLAIYLALCVASVKTKRLEFLAWYGRYLPLLAFVLGLALAPERWQRLLVLACLVCGMGCVCLFTTADAGMIYYYVAALALLQAARERPLAYAVPLAAYGAAGAFHSLEGPVALTRGAWGWATILLAFIVFGIALAITRWQLTRSRKSGSQPVHVGHVSI
ncbi:MAG: hypothetical protein L6R28_09540 [Planctomycetes bacterium]|nr:hypothetical protein [Planctomycetota bacterium]